MSTFSSLIRKFNEFLAMRATLVVGTMWCFYAFTALSLAPLLFPKVQDKILYVSNCFQLVFLPLIMVGQSLMGQNAESREQQDHEMLMAELAEIKEMHADLKRLMEKEGVN